MFVRPVVKYQNNSFEIMFIHVIVLFKQDDVTRLVIVID